MVQSLGQRLHRFKKERKYLKAPLKYVDVFKALAESNMYRHQEPIINSLLTLLYNWIACTCLFSGAKYLKLHIAEACVYGTQTQSHFPYTDMLPSPRLLRLLYAAAFVTLHNPTR